MAHPANWHGKDFFCPIGNTSAVCLTRDIAPEDPADILLLGCGDPRHVLYTIFCEPQNANRKLDFTCCDIEPAILARNVLLFTMIIDKRPYTTVIWNTFFHIYLDKASHSALVEQCKKLLKFSDNLHRWDTSPYGAFIKMSTEYTFAEIRRHWLLYVEMRRLPRARAKSLETAFAEQFKQSSNDLNALIIPPAAHSSDSLMSQATHVLSEQTQHYWKTGVTASDGTKVAAGKILNPTFVYSLGGEGTSIHYATDPLTPFHFAALFGNSKGSITGSDTVKAAKAEFGDWCSAYDTATASRVSKAPVIRVFVGEAIAVCRALYAYASTGTLDIGVPVAQWKTQYISLSKDEYASGGAPATFNVIETSNLVDHIGLLNILIAAVPLLSTPAQSSVLYTESLLFRGKDATKEFTELLHADLTTVSLLLDLCPVDYLSGFTTRSNTHELLMHMTPKDSDKDQFHHVTTWKSPMSGDAAAARGRRECLPPVFDPRQLGTLLYDIYRRMFEQGDSRDFMRLAGDTLPRAIPTSDKLIHYMRETFALFLRLVRERLSVPQTRWQEVMDRFFNLQSEEELTPSDHNQDLYGQLHRHGVYTVPVYQSTLPRTGRFLQWQSVPPVVRVFLVVPRENLTVMEDKSNPLLTPLLQCEVRGDSSPNIFTAIHVAFGKPIPVGTKACPQLLCQEDPKGREGSSPLVVSFTMPAQMLTDVDASEKLRVCLSVRTTDRSVRFAGEPGLGLTLFSAKLLDEYHVHIVPEQPLPPPKPHVPPSSIPPITPRIGAASAAVVELDEQCELVSTLTIRVSVENEQVTRLFSSDSTPEIAQRSACVMRLTVGLHGQDLTYPFPVIGSENKLRLARKSLYIEIIVPVSGPFRADGMKLNPFPVVGTGRNLSPWSIHRLQLSCLPTLDIKSKKVEEWLNPHVGSIMSPRKRSLRNKQGNDPLMLVRDTLHTIFVRSAGIQGGPAQRVFSLYYTLNSDTVFFISDLRFDPHSHTMVCDGYVLPLTKEIMPEIEKDIYALVCLGNMEAVTVHEREMDAWKKLLPAFVERCRSSWAHGENCEYQLEGKIPLTQTMGLDPLCSCGRGKDVDAMEKVRSWKNLTPYVTRIALSPLFAV